MNIVPLSNYGYTQRSQGKVHANDLEAGKSAGDVSERLSVQLTSTTREIFASDPEIRPEVVERGRELLADPNYPPQHVVERTAALIIPFV